MEILYNNMHLTSQVSPQSSFSSLNWWLKGVHLEVDVGNMLTSLFQKIWFINGVDNVNWPSHRHWKADVSSISPSSERIRSDEGLTLWQRANTRNVSFSISVRWSIYIINSVDKPNFHVSLPHWRSTTVSSETNPLNFFRVSVMRYLPFFSGCTKTGYMNSPWKWRMIIAINFSV